MDAKVKTLFLALALVLVPCVLILAVVTIRGLCKGWYGIENRVILEDVVLVGRTK